MSRVLLVVSLLVASAAPVSCHRGIDDYYLKYTLYREMAGKKTWKIVVLPPYGYMQYSDLPRRPYDILWDYLMRSLDSLETFEVVTKDTSLIMQVTKRESPGWEIVPEMGTARATALGMGAEAVCVVEIQSILEGHEANDPEMRAYYVVVLKTRIVNTETGEMLYEAKSRGEVYEDLAGSMMAAVDNMIWPFHDAEKK
ncbi:MAG: hypothetical protein ACP5QG_07120 [candidate division WOR-3 bacterium]